QTGLLSGNPTQAGTFPFTVEVLIGGQCRKQQQYTLVINAGGCTTITLSPTTLTAGPQGTPYNANISASPAATYTFSVSAGALPAGLQLNASTGALSGTPTATGTFTFTIRATNTKQCTGERQYMLTINQTCPAIIVNPANGTLPAGTMGTAYAQQT